MPANLSVSSGSSFLTSSDPIKSVSRYAHVRWISFMMTTTSATPDSLLCHPVTSSSNVERYREPIMFWTCSWWSSRVSKSSSESLMSCTSVSLCCVKTNSSETQVPAIFLSACSIFSSFCARLTISPTSSSKLWSCRLIRSSSLNLSLISILTPVRSISIDQCRSRIDGWRRSETRGIVARKFLTLVSAIAYALVDLTDLSKERSCLNSILVPSSICSQSMLSHSVFFHSVICMFIISTMCHSCSTASRSEWHLS
mmetsp:Transcript_46114/g.112312  ORF Transcript_46114/g.112312 Transcript_46114/m.112312 type:complete len:255 (-) Transcript_46114:245-1009(-)